MNINNRTWWSNNHPDHTLPPGEGSEIEATTSAFVLNGEWQLKVRKFCFDLTTFSKIVLSSKFRTISVRSDSLYRIGASVLICLNICQISKKDSVFS